VLFVVYANLTVVAVRYYGVPTIVAGSVYLLLGIPFINYVVFQRQNVIFSRTFFLMVLYLGVMLLSAAFSELGNEAISRIVDYVLEGLALYFLIVNTIRKPATLRAGIWAIVFAGILMGSLSLYQELTGSYDQEFGGLAQVEAGEINSGEVDYLGQEVKRQRLAGTLGSKNRYAQVMAVLLPLAILRAWSDHSRLFRLIAAVAWIPILAGTLLTFSRGAGLAIIAMVLMMVALRIVKARYVVALALAGALFVYVAVPDYIYRLSTVSGVEDVATGNAQEADGSIRGRATVALATFNIFLDHPILGVGPGQTKKFTQDYGNEVGFRRLETERKAHNMYLETLADTGIIGFTVFMAIVLTTMYELDKIRRRWAATNREVSYTAAAFLLAIFTYLATAVFLHLSYIRFYYLLLGLAGAAIEIYRERPENDQAAAAAAGEGTETQGVIANV
jgi:O-antigen ligase